MADLFGEGGKIFWVAPSGGRDRPDESGAFAVAPFDAKALDMFKILAMQSKKVRKIWFHQWPPVCHCKV